VVPLPLICGGIDFAGNFVRLPEVLWHDVVLSYPRRQRTSRPYSQRQTLAGSADASSGSFHPFLDPLLTDIKFRGRVSSLCRRCGFGLGGCLFSPCGGMAKEEGESFTGSGRKNRE
jgi:hypothetical protein